jgi:hypothetical protein
MDYYHVDGGKRNIGYIRTVHVDSESDEIAESLVRPPFSTINPISLQHSDKFSATKQWLMLIVGSSPMESQWAP